jgi:hypothetical protein
MKRSQRSARTKVLRGPAAVLVVLGVVLGSSAFLASSAWAATADTVAGGAFGLTVTTAGTTTVPPTPVVTLPATGAAQQSTLATVPANPLISSIVATVTTAGTNVGGASEQVTSSSTVSTVVVTASHTGISATSAASTCTANAAGSVGSTTITGLTIGGTPEALPSPVAPTTRLPSVVTA